MSTIAQNSLVSIGAGVHVAVGTAGPTSKAACFDLDWTLIRPVRGRFPKDANDWTFLPNRISTLKSYQQAGYTLAIFTNQGYTGAKLTMALQRVNNVISSFHQQGLYPWVFVATLQNEYRKPSPGMWAVFEHNQKGILKSDSLYVGDAAGRVQDYDDNDREFAKNVGIPFYVPEQLFPNNPITIPTTQTLLIAVGMPGSGKSTFYEQNLKSRGWIHANQDLLKTAAKVKSTVEAGLASGKSVYIDATNPSADKRREYILLAVKYQVPTMILYFVQNGYEWNKHREKPVPDIAYNMYFKNLVEPTYELDRVPVVELF
jgi:bifunctional polynucleotide phosphatase/kinase